MTFDELMNCYSGNKKNYDSLLLQQKNRNLIPFFGAGMSKWANYPLWKELLEELAEETKFQNNIASFLKNEEYEKAASFLEKNFFNGTLARKISEVFSAEKLKNQTRPKYQELIVSLFQGPIVTTNFDEALENLFNFNYSFFAGDSLILNDCLSRIQSYDSFLIKLHGNIHAPSTLIFTESSYNEFYGNDSSNPDLNKELPKVLSAIYQKAFPFFLGCSLGSDRTFTILKNLGGLRGFALVELPKETHNPNNPIRPILHEKENPENLIPVFSERIEQLSKLDVIWYPYGCHDAVQLLIERLYIDCQTAKDSSKLLSDNLNLPRKETSFRTLFISFGLTSCRLFELVQGHLKNSKTVVYPKKFPNKKNAKKVLPPIWMGLFKSQRKSCLQVLIVLLPLPLLDPTPIQGLKRLFF